MDAHTVRIFGFILAASVRVEGMKAENQARIARGECAAYGEDAFNIEAAHIESLAREV